jgi:hypothetical protein
VWAFKIFFIYLVVFFVKKIKCHFGVAGGCGGGGGEYIVSYKRNVINYILSNTVRVVSGGGYMERCVTTVFLAL